jgi:antitoxin (DNA-binding transcriptional repressor) of toxin-antitoxin stability system
MQRSVASTMSSKPGVDRARNRCARAKGESLRDCAHVRRQRARYIITYRGRPVGLLAPLDQTPDRATSGESTAWDELTRLGQEIGRNWPAGVTSADILSATRQRATSTACATASASLTA